jgi:hypothetical protein
VDDFLIAEADTIARVVGVGGLVLAAIGTVLGLLNYVRDRPKLAVSMRIEYGRDRVGVPQDPTLVVVVASTGRHPLSIVDVSLCSWGGGHRRWKIRLLVKWPFLRRLLGVPNVIWGAKPVKPVRTPTVLQPAESLTFEFPRTADVAERLKAEDEHDFVSVVDIVGRELRALAPEPSRVVSNADGSVTTT